VDQRVNFSAATKKLLAARAGYQCSVLNCGRLTVGRGPGATDLVYLAVLRRAELLTTQRQGRYVRYTVNLPALTALGTDLLAAVLR
jgi:hypothetical protein